MTSLATHPQSSGIHQAQKLLAERRRASGITAPLSTDLVYNTPEKIGSLLEVATDDPILPKEVRVYPTLAAAFLSRGPAVGRVYFLSRAFDQLGCGMVKRDNLKNLLTDRNSNWACMSWRRLRQILNQGDGLTWEVLDTGYIRLFSTANVAINLDIGVLRGRPVYVPVEDLTAGIKRVRAAFYSSFHSSRKAPMPIARETLRNITGVPERTQREYDRVIETGVKRNIATASEDVTEENVVRRLDQGRMVFPFIDYLGKLGEKGGRSLAWQLPNSYSGPYQYAPRGRQRKHNRKINLVIKEQRGTGTKIVRTFHSTAHIAARRAADEPDRDHYYPIGNTPALAPEELLQPVGVGAWRCLP